MLQGAPIGFLTKAAIGDAHGPGGDAAWVEKLSTLLCSVAASSNDVIHQDVRVQAAEVCVCMPVIFSN